MAFARHQFELSAPQDDGLPLIDHLRSVERQTGRAHPMIADGPPIPPGCAQLWIDFLELHGSRGSAGFGMARITFADIRAWQDVRGVRFDQWEIDCIRKVDDMWLRDFAPKPETKH